MKIQKFNGGLSTRKEPYLIQTNEGQVYTNVNNNQESLQPVNTPLAAGETYTENHRYIKFSKTIEQLDKTPTSIVEYKNKIYYSVDDDFVQMKDNNTEGDLGFWSPTLIASDTVTARPSVASSADITDSATIVYASFGFNAEWAGFRFGKTYQFAFQQEDSEGRLSDVFFWNWSPPAPDNFYTLNISLPYKYRIYLKTGGVWRQAYGTRIRRIVPSTFETQYRFDTNFWDLVKIGTASQTVSLTPGNFLITEGPVVDNTVKYQPNLGVNYYGFAYADTGVVPASYTYASVEVDLDTVVVNGVDLVAGTYSYLAEVHSTTLGWSSEPSNLINIVVTSGTQASMEINELDNGLIGNEVSDSRIDQLRIYRVGGNFTDFTRVATFDDPVFPIQFTDTVSEVSAQGSPILESEDYDKPLSGLKNLAVVGGQLCGTIGTKLHFSLPDKPFAFPSTNYRDFREELTGLYTIDAGLIVCSLNNTWLLNTANLGVGKVIKLSDEFGCTGHNTMVGYRTGAMWASVYGIVASFGGKVELMTKDAIDFTNLNILHAEVYNEVYWGFTEQNTLWALDFRFGFTLKFFDFALFNDNLPDTVVHQAYRENQDLKVLWGAPTAVDSYALFGDTDSLAQLSWKSAKFIEGSYTEIKAYKDIFIRASGKLTIKTYIEDQEEAGNLVAETAVNGLGTYHIKVDSEALQGYAIWFTAVGTGTIYEIEYKAMGRKNGR